jgi:hypothetical protein
MKRVFFGLLLISICLFVCSCGYTGKTIADFTICLENSNSIVVKRNQTPMQIFKGYDIEGKAFLLETGQIGEISVDKGIGNIIELPEGLTDFEIIGYSDNNYVDKKCDILIDSNIGFYVICPRTEQWFDYKYDVYKVENDSSISGTLKNIVYKSNEKYVTTRYYNNVLKFASINNNNDNINFVKGDEELTLIENKKLKNAFFLIAIDDSHLADGYEYNNIIVLDEDNNVFYYSISPSFEILINKKMEFENLIINYGIIIQEDTKIHRGVNNPFDEEDPEFNRNYFYILTENELFIYDKLGEIFYCKEIENPLYGINFVNNYSTFEVQLAYKTDNNLFKWEKTIIERGNLSEE